MTNKNLVVSELEQKEEVKKLLPRELPRDRLETSSSEKDLEVLFKNKLGFFYSIFSLF